MFAGVRQLAGIFLAIVFFQHRKVRKMKSIYLQLSVSLAAATQVWVQAAAQGVEQALVSVTVDIARRF